MISLRLRPLAVAFVVLASGRLALAQAVPAAGEAPDKLEPFVVTGSYIPTTETAVEAGPSPVVRIDRKQIAETGLTNTAELLQSITVSNANAVPISNNSTGFTPAASSISLRGLGPEATLVLINGRRVAAYPVGAGGSTAFVDLNSIPLSAIESIEVLKDGASSIYGADAVAGVINVKLRRGLDGSEVFSSYGNTTHQDSSEVVASVATGAVNDKVTLLAGANYYQRQSILHRDRAYSAIAPRLSENSSPMNFELTRFSVANALGQPLQAAIPGVGPAAIFFFAQSGADAANNGTKPASAYTFSPDRSSTYNPNDAAMTYPEIERLGGFASAERKLFGTDNVKGYVDLSYQNVRTEYHLAPTPTGDFTALGQTELIIPARTANPILTLVNPFLGFVVQVPAGFAVPPGSFPGPGTQFVNGTAQRLAAPGAFNPNNPFNQDIADGSRGRLTEFGNRIIRNRTDAFMTTVGVKGDNLAGRWNFDGSFSYSSIRDETRNSLVSASRFNDIVNANSPIFNRGSSSFIGTTTPYNPFGYYRNRIAANDATTNYARVTVKDTNESTLAQVSAVLSTADLLKFPHGSVGFAVGVDFRREQLDQEPDAFGSSGDLIGQAPRATTTAQRKIGGMFAEAKVPMLPRLEATLSLRHERFYTSDDDVTVPKAGLRWQPIARQLTVRGSYSEGFREPSLFERYSTPISVLSSILDPRDGFVEPEQRVTLRGNRKLEAEKTDYANLGFIWSPTTPRLKGADAGRRLLAHPSRRHRRGESAEHGLSRFRSGARRSAGRRGGFSFGERRDQCRRRGLLQRRPHAGRRLGLQRRLPVADRPPRPVGAVDGVDADDDLRARGAARCAAARRAGPRLHRFRRERVSQAERPGVAELVVQGFQRVHPGFLYGRVCRCRRERRRAPGERPLPDQHSGGLLVPRRPRPVPARHAGERRRAQSLRLGSAPLPRRRHQCQRVSRIPLHRGEPILVRVGESEAVSAPGARSG